MAAEGGIVRFVYRDGGRDTIPPNATHVTIHESVTVISDFCEHQNIVEVRCHAGVKEVKGSAFYRCPRLERLIMPGVEVVGEQACGSCEALTYIECPKLKIIELDAFVDCWSLSHIDLPSAVTIGGSVFPECDAMEEVKFGKDLESIGRWAFHYCPSLERITIPLKNGLLPYDNTFQECGNLNQVTLVEKEVLNDTVSALLWDEWRDEMRGEIDSINHNLSNANAGGDRYDGRRYHFVGCGRKAIVLREWISLVLRKIIHYKAQHRQILNEATAALELLLPNDMVANNVLPFLELPAHTFDGEEDYEGA